MNVRPPSIDYHSARCLEALSLLKAKGFPIPAALESVSEPRALALTTREDIGSYVASHGGGEDETRLLVAIVAALTRTPRYVEALASDLGPRVSILTGEAVDVVSETDRHSAALLTHARALRSASKAGVQDLAPAKPKPPPKPPKPPAPPPLSAQRPAATTPAPSPFRNGGQLSAAEMERRKEALAVLKPKTSAVESA